MIMWDFSNGCPFLVVDFANDEDKNGNAGRFYNPAFIHSMVVPETDMLDKLGKLCAVARGEGVISVINIESELAVEKAKRSGKSRKSSQGSSSSADTCVDFRCENERKRLHLDYSLGGHSAAASCVTFSCFGERGKLISSGGNDKSVKIWDWSKYLDESIENKDVALSINSQKKVNWLCTTPADTDNLVVCDTTKVVKVYTST